MKRANHPRKLLHLPSRNLLFSILSTALLVFGLLTPLIPSKVSADSSGATEFNVYPFRTQFPNEDVNNYGSCVAEFDQTPTVITGQFLSDNFYKNINNLINNPKQEAITYVGNFEAQSNAGDLAAVKYVIGLIGQQVTLIHFRAADGNGAIPGDPVAGPFTQGDNNNHSNKDLCSSASGNPYVMFPISNNEWRGSEAINSEVGSGVYGRYIWFSYTGLTKILGGTKTQGTFTYSYPKGKGNVFPAPDNAKDSQFIMNHVWLIGGGGAIGGGTGYHAKFIDARQLQIVDGPYAGEIYQKNAWGGDAPYSNNAFYYLTQDTAKGDRAGLAAGTECVDPLPFGSVCTSDTTQQNSVPFIDMGMSFDMSYQDPGLADLNNRANRMAGLGTNPSFTLYDYNNDGTIAQYHPITLNNSTDGKIWLAYSTKNDEFMTIFTSGSGHEQIYLTEYKKAGGVYKGGTGGCNATIKATPPSGASTAVVFAADWTLYNSSCVTPYGTFHVYALGGNAGEQLFTSTVAQAQGDLPTPTEPKIGCDSLGGPLNWIICPALDAMTATVKVLDASITDLLNIKPEQFFDDNNPTGQAYHKAWGVFRTFAIALILIAALVMVLGQALGVEIASAYTLRKMLPVIIMTIIGISVLWPLSRDAVVATNDISGSIRSILYIPFSGLAAQGVNLNNVGTTIGALFLVGGALAYGIFGLLSLAVTAVMAVIIAYVLLVLRLILFAAWLMSGPFALGLGILFPKARKIWLDTGFGILLISILWSVDIAVGNDFTITALSGSQNASQQTLWQLVAVGVYYGKYFVFFIIVRSASGLMATIGGFVNDRSRGAFDRVKGYRRQTLAKRGQKFTSGSLFRENRLTRPLNAVGRRVGAAQAGAGVSAFMPTRRGQQARALYDSQLAEQTLKNNPLLHELQNNDDANNLLGLSGGSLAGLEQAANDLGFTGERRRNAMAAARAAGVNRANALAALKTSMQNKARGIGAGNVRAMHQGVRRLARNNAEYQSFAQQAAFFARSNGRADLGGTDWIDYQQTGGAWAQARAVAPGNEMGQWQAIADRNIMNGIERLGVQQMVSGHDNQAIQAVQTLGRVLRTAPHGSDQRVQAAVALKELQGNMPAGASGGVRDAINRVLYNPIGADQYSLGLDDGGNIGDQLAAITGRAGLTGTALTNRGRVYPEVTYGP